MRLGRTRWGARGAALLVLVIVAGILAGCDRPPPVLRGQVTDSADGSHPAGVVVRVYAADQELMVAETATDGEGRFVFRESDLEEGTYHVRFSDSSWWEDAGSWDAASEVTVTYDSATVLNPTISPSTGSVSGTVRDSAGPLPGAGVEAITPLTGAVVASTTSGGDGAFAMDDLPTGRYRLKVSASDHAPTYFPSATTATGASSVTVTSGQVADDVDIVVPDSATLSGTVVAGTEPRSGVTVAATTLAPHEVHGVAVTGPDGRFEINGLSPTGYLLLINDSEGNLGSAVAGASTDDPDTGTAYPLAPGGSLDAGTIDIADGGSTSPTIATAELPEAFVGMPVQAALDAVGGNGDYVWAASGLPDGVTIDPETGVISGVPTAAGATTIGIDVTDTRGQSSSASLTLDVQPGMPAECVADDCALVDLSEVTTEISADLVAAADRDAEGTLTDLTLTAAASPVALDQILVVAPGEHTPDGVIVRVTSVEDLGAQGQTVAVERADLTDAYESALIKSTEATVTPLDEASTDTTSAEPSFFVAPRATPTAVSAGGSCDQAAEVSVSPDVDLDVDPYVSVLFGKNWFGFGNIFVGTGGLKTVQAQLDTTLTVGLSGEISGSVDCAIDVPGARAAVPLGSAGFVTFRLEPELSLKASAAASVDTHVTLHCSMFYRWNEGQTSQFQWCRPTSSGPGLTGLGADVTVGGGITATATYNELVGISGNIDAQLHGRYRPQERPRGQFGATVSATLSACGACLFGSEAPSFTLAEGTLYDRIFATWGYEPIPDNPPSGPCADLADSTWHGWLELSEGSDPTYGSWRAFFDSSGSLTNIDVYFEPNFGGSPISIAASNVATDCDTIEFDAIPHWSGTFNTSRTQLSGSYAFADQPSFTWAGSRAPLDPPQPPDPPIEPEPEPSCASLVGTSWEGTFDLDPDPGTGSWRATFDDLGAISNFEFFLEPNFGGGALHSGAPLNPEVSCDSISFTALADWSGTFNVATSQVNGSWMFGTSGGQWSGGQV